MLNKKTKMFLLLTLIFFTAVGLSAVSATEIDADATDMPVATQEIADGSDYSVDTAQSDLSNKNTQLNKKTVENVKSEGEGNFTELARDIAGAEVTLSRSYIQAERESSINIASDKVINANGNSITAHNGTFNIAPGVTFTLKNVTIYSHYAPNMQWAQRYYYDIYNNNATVILEDVSFIYTGDGRQYGAPVYVNGIASLDVINCHFDGHDTNRALIYANSNGEKITVDNTVFNNYNTANSAIYAYGSNTTITVTNSNFTNAGVPTGTGINYAAGINTRNYAQNVTMYVENCRFENLTCGNYGGAIRTRGDTTVKDSTFKNITQTSATNNAGAIYVDANGYTLYLENNVMEDLTANAADIYFNNGNINSTVKVIGENITANEDDPAELTLNVTDDNGNSIGFRSNPFTVTINGTTIATNYTKGAVTSTFDASFDPGSYLIDITYTGSEIVGEDNPEIPENNLTVIDAGYYRYKTVTRHIENARLFDDVLIDENVIRGSTENSIIVNKMVNLDFQGNTIDARQGKVFDILSDAVVTIKNAVIINVGNPDANISNSEGRLANITGGALIFENVTFKNGNAPDFGSSASGSFILVLHNDSYLKLNDCYITNCTGTFINIVNGTVDIDNTIFEKNRLANVNAFIANGGSLKIVDSQFISNNVNLDVIRGQSNMLPESVYGRTFLTDNQPLTIDNTTFISNRATNGRGIVNSKNDATITNSVFIKNHQSSSNPGAAVFSEDGLLDIDSCIFINNTISRSMENDGTTIYNDNGDMNIRNSIIISNMEILCAVKNNAVGDVVANNNYWGQADPRGKYASTEDASEITVDNWVMLGITVTPSEDIKYKDNVTITVGFTPVSADGTEFEAKESLPDYGYVEFEADYGVFEYDTVDVVDGSASDVVNVQYDPVEVIATYMNDEVGITLDVNMPEPMDITLNDGNWTKYFDEVTGIINEDLVVPNSILRFDGVFTERDMVIDMPVVITTADNQAILNNCTITVMADYVNITDIQMNSEDYSDVLIETFDSSFVVIKNNILTITNNEADQITRAIKVTNGEYNVIEGNNITTVGPEKDFNYYTGIVYTTSIEAVTSDDLIIKGNTISTEKNDVAATASGTIYGIYVTGATEDYITNLIYDVEISGNDIATAGEAYDYGITVKDAEYATIYNNTISTVSDSYANGIQATGLVDSVIEENTIECASESLAYGIYISGDMMEIIESEHNDIINNTISISSINAWGIELVYGKENTVTLNDITIDCGYGVGIAISQDTEDEITENTINVIATMEGEPDTQDMISPIPAGVKVVNCDDYYSMWELSDDNVIKNNNIIVDAPDKSVPAVNVTARTSITENYLVSPKGVGNAAVLNNATGTTIRDNTPLVYILTNDTYYDFFDEDFVFMNNLVENGSYIEVRGPISEKNYFIFDNVELVIVNGEDGVLYNATIMTLNDAKVTFDGLVIDNIDQEAVYFESDGNVLKNSEIKVNSSLPLYVVYVEGDNNCISNVAIDATLPSNNAIYSNDFPYPLVVPASAALIINSSNNLVDGVDINVDGSEAYEGSYSPTINGIYVISLDPSEPIVKNTISNSNVQVVGCNCDGYNYAYGINVGVANDTTLDNVVVEVFGNYYANALQLWSAHIVSAGGVFSADANNYTYGVYATAMGGGISDNIIIVGSEIDAEAADATGILFEGVKDSAIIHSAIYVEGTNATAIADQIDWLQNVPSGLEVLGNEIYVTTDGDKNVMYFGSAEDISVTSNTIKAQGGSEIYFFNTTKGVITENYIMINDVLIGNHAVISTEDDTVIEDNTPVNEEYEAMLELLKMYQTSIITIDDIDNVTYRDEVTITGKLNDGMGNLIPDQTLTITVGDLIDTVTTENGLFEYTMVAWQMGLNTVTITYEGTENHNEAEATAEFTVDKKESEITLNDIETVACNDDVTIKGKVTSVDGIALGHVNVYIYYNGEEQHVTTYKDGVFKTTFTTSTVGEQEVLVVYNGNTKYLASNTTATVTTTGVKLVMYKIKNATYRDEYTVRGKLTDYEGNAIADAEVQLTINDEVVTVNTDSNGIYVYQAKATKAGDFTVTASYDGGEPFTQVTASKTLTVTKRSVTLTVDDIASAKVGDEVTITGKLTDLTGTLCKNCNIYVTINGEQQHIYTDDQAIYTCTYTPTTAGTQNVIVTYKGNTNYLGDEVTTTFEVTD